VARAALAGLALLAGGCFPVHVLEDSAGEEPSTGPGEDGTGGATTNSPTTGAPSTGGAPDGACDFPGEVQPIFNDRCAGCHSGASAQMGLDLAEGAAHTSLVGVDSAEQPGTPRVAAGDPAGSFLMMKVGANPPVGARMPIGGELSAAEMATLTAWIAAGAPASETFACAGGQQSDVGAVEIDPGTLRGLKVGDVAAVSAVVLDAEGEPLPDAAVQWKSSDGLTLYVDGVGGLLGVSPGQATIVAVAGGIASEPFALDVIPATPPSAPFTAVNKLTTGRCAVSGCHVDGVEPGDLRFDRDPEDVWEELVEDAAEQVPGLRRVVPHDPKASYLMHKLALDVPQVGGRMPLAQPPLPASEVQVVLRWILGGANND
jgi:hypothetical protein